MRKKEVAEVAKDVLNNKSDVSEFESSLIQQFHRLDRNGQAERDAMKQILRTNLLMAKALGQMVKEVAMLKNKIATLETRQLA